MNILNFLFLIFILILSGSAAASSSTTSSSTTPPQPSSGPFDHAAHLVCGSRKRSHDGDSPRHSNKVRRIPASFANVTESVEKDANTKGLQWHIDQNVNGFLRPFQVLMHWFTGTQTNRNQDRRCFMFITHSWKHWDFFVAYFKTHGTPNFKPDSAPAFLPKWFTFNKFIQDLEHLKAGNERESAWATYCAEHNIPIPKDKFELRITRHVNNQMILFRTRTIHCVTSGFVRKGPRNSPPPEIDMCRWKVTVEVLNGKQPNPNVMPADILSTDGSYKKLALRHELNNTNAPTAFDIYASGLDPTRLDDIVADLNNSGVAFVNNVLADEHIGDFIAGISNHMKSIMNLPRRVDLTNPKHASTIVSPNGRTELGITNKHLRRNENDSRTQIVAKSAGNTGMGANSQHAIQLMRTIYPFINEVYTRLVPDGNFASIKGLGINPQPIYFG